MIDNRIEVGYLSWPVESHDQAVSLTEYMKSHGLLAYQEPQANGGHWVVTPVEGKSKADISEQSATVYTVLTTWRMFWAHSDKGVFELPIYVK